jgi:hypothetical protein
MRARIWIFTALVALALALNLARLSLSIAQTGEDTMRARVAAASTALRGQLDLLDARLAPRAVSMMPDLIDAVRGGEGQPSPRPDERALRAAAAVLAPEPDLLAVVSPHGAIVSRRARPLQLLENPAQLPLAQTASGAMPPPTFAAFDNTAYRFAAARVPGAAAAAVVATVIDDRFAAQLKSQVDADVTLIQNGRILASSLPQAEERAGLLRWAAAPGPGYGVLQIRLPFVGIALSGKLPWGGNRHAVRGALIPLDGGVQAALTVPASPYLAWLGRYQAFYLLGLALFVFFGFVWGLFTRPPPPVVQQAPAPADPFESDDGVVSPPRRAPRTPSLVGTDLGEPPSAAPRTRDVPVSAGARPSAGHRVARSGSAAAASKPAVEALDPDLPAPDGPESAKALAVDEQDGAMTTASGVWGGDSFAASGPFANAAPGAGQAVPDWDMPPAPAPEPQAEPRAEPFPGDEPTRAEGVSAALIDKLRERDEQTRPAANEAPDGNVTLQDFSLPPAGDSDPDEPHWREAYDQFRELKAQLGEPADRISFEKFAAKLKKNRTELVAKHNCKGVRFSVYEKDGKAAIKASAIR